MFKLGIDVNTTDTALWDKAHEEMIKQRPLVYSFVMDEIFNIMQSGEASIGAYYAGDYFTMMEDQADDVDLQFYYPEHTNMFIRNVYPCLCTEQGTCRNIHQLYARRRSCSGKCRIHILCIS